MSELYKDFVKKRDHNIHTSNSNTRTSNPIPAPATLQYLYVFFIYIKNKYLKIPCALLKGLLNATHLEIQCALSVRAWYNSGESKNSELQ